ncbi:MAG: DEAD/DEAH box helicase [Chloracidobacterium sp.]|nr:DEAD/DEAH box helicase [Chloracidobacterium sp.]
MDEVFDRPFGKPGSFLADAAFEAVYGWRTGGQSMADLAGSLLAEELVNAMDNPPKDLKADYRFPRDQHPYLHQIEAWEILSQESPESLIVASGTGSGKTECFMVPILDRLVRLQQVQKTKLAGVRALFLYPLNALINSQRERLRAWTHAFGSDIRFCLYNGNTPENLNGLHHKANPNEVMDRKTLRSSPPPILVTNASMLEYMLVRTTDAPILDQSEGKLEWIVLDEAHSYIGSQAAEAALLIRRVLNAFGVAPDQVRFVATSATIGDPNGEAGLKLKKFLADVAGVSDEDRVHLVAGERVIPSLHGIEPTGNESLNDLKRIAADGRFETISKNRTARKIRDKFVGNPSTPPIAKLSDICELLNGEENPSREGQIKSLEWLDLLSGTLNENGESFLPLRSHFFHQTMSGLWACTDQECPNRADFLNDPDWHFGQVYTDPRKHCDCGAPAYELVMCASCGSAQLLAGVDDEGFVAHLRPKNALDDFELDVDPGEEIEDTVLDELPVPSQQFKMLILNQKLEGVGLEYIDRETRRMGDPSSNSVAVWAVEDNGSGLSCPVCNEKDTKARPLLQNCRIGAPYLLDGILPTLLEFAPDGNDAANRPWRGRKLLTFNDSRQGTARLAANLQLGSERNRVRALIYHLTLRDSVTGSVSDRRRLEHDVRQLETALDAGPNSVVETMLSDKQAELEKLKDPSPVGFNQLAQELAHQGQDFMNMLARYRRYSESVFTIEHGAHTLAKTFLIREFGRRPKRLVNLESMGLVSTAYPLLQGINRVPQVAIEASQFDLDTWRDFLKICLDFFVRAGGSLAIDDSWRRWLGMPFPQSFLVARTEDEPKRDQRRWPSAKFGRNSTLVRLLSFVLNADAADPDGHDRINAVLDSAWEDLCSVGLLKQGDPGFTLPLDRLAFIPIRSGWICPVTRRVLDVTLRGVTPYLPRTAAKETVGCVRVEIPQYAPPFSGVTNELEQIEIGREWVLSNQDVAKLREEGLWSNSNDRVIELSPYYTTAEHSAQQDSTKLKLYESDFKEGKINVLSCSTTMEMGIDIGGISVAAMNNVPPHPANYLQRAGRAGRRREARSVVMTLCKSNPHDQSVFANSRWAFDTPLPAPRVALDSPVIVQRHANSFLLSRFLREQLRGTSNEQTKLSCGMFFLEGHAGQFEAWCRSFDVEEHSDIAGGLNYLFKRSIYDGQSVKRVVDISGDMIKKINDAWMREWERLESESAALRARGSGESDAAVKAVDLHKERQRGEYLLGELASRGFLPAYGFPTNIAPFDNLTVSQFKRRFQNPEGRDDNRYKRRELASRDLVSALREYAPGSEVVMDGLVYRSAGVTLNWHIPADQDQVKEVQSIKTAWRCRACGASGSKSFVTDLSCERCGSAVVTPTPFLEPSGFAVDFYTDPTNDTSSQHFVPVEAPWINADGQWLPLLNPELGRFRSTTQGHIFNQSKGEFGLGYAVCLECGRAEPVTKKGEIPAGFARPHRKLRRSKADAATCPGSNENWKIKQDLALGTEGYTDVFELQLKNDAGVWLNDPMAALTIAVAVRDSLAELMGVQANELGCDIKPARLETDGRCQSILIYDRFAAGYSSRAEDHMTELFKKAWERLICPANCDSACPRCILDYDQRFVNDRLDRKKALKILSTVWLDRFRLPDELAFFGTDRSHLEPRTISESIWQAVINGGVQMVRLFAGGDLENWDVAASPLRALAFRLVGQNVKVEIIVPEDAKQGLDSVDLYPLANLAGHPDIEVKAITELPRVGDAYLLAETAGKVTKWAVGDVAVTEFNPNWGISDNSLVKGDDLVRLDYDSPALSMQDLLPAAERSDRQIDIGNEIDGPVRGFGNRFWNRIMAEHSAAGDLLNSANERVIGVSYSDRYLFDPLSVALLTEIAKGLKALVGVRWEASAIGISTMDKSDVRLNPWRLFHNWVDMNARNRVMEMTLGSIGLQANIHIFERRSEIEHGRAFRIELSSGKIVEIRLDQGMGYWAIPWSTNARLKEYNFTLPHESQCANLVALTTNIEGQGMGTQVFLRVRER